MRVKDLTPDWLIKTHFFGMYGKDASGKFYLANPQNPSAWIEESVLQEAIFAAISRIESQLGLSIMTKEQITEFHDYDADTFRDHMMVNLREYPVSRVHSLQIVRGEHGDVIWEIPFSSIQTHGYRSKFGMLQFLPLGQFFDGGGLGPLLHPGGMLFGVHYMPSFIKVVYDAGLDGWVHGGGKGGAKGLPHDLVRAIGLLAAIHPLNILGDLVIGAGVASFSQSVDGVSQSVSTTASAENAAFSARIIMHRKELFGEQGVPGLFQNLVKQWQRPVLGLL